MSVDSEPLETIRPDLVIGAQLVAPVRSHETIARLLIAF